MESIQIYSSSRFERTELDMPVTDGRIGGETVVFLATPHEEEDLKISLPEIKIPELLQGLKSIRYTEETGQDSGELRFVFDCEVKPTEERIRTAEELFLKIIDNTLYLEGVGGKYELEFDFPVPHVIDRGTRRRK